jgi:RNA polymerase sigma factor (sigma-70 family)
MQDVAKHQALIHWQARKYGWSGAEYDELISAGMMGMAVANDRFDPTRGVKFSTYATWWIRSHIQKHIRHHIKENHQSLDVEDHNGRTGLEKVASEETHQANLTQLTAQVLASLPHREAAIIGRRFGLDVPVKNRRSEIVIDARQTLHKLRKDV